EVLRENIRLIIEKLEAFKRNGYTNVGLKEASLEHSPPPGPILLGREAFMEARRALSGLTLKSSEMSEAEGYIDKIEEICFAALSDEQKWETLRPIVFWASGKPMRLAMLILPLFLNVSS
ncbi:MAG: hypothetical protein IJC39_03055, partial [Firmicutes bacterium]|nr:hypothetical protein [Bacillota bacterium]